MRNKSHKQDHTTSIFLLIILYLIIITSCTNIFPSPTKDLLVPQNTKEYFNSPQTIAVFTSTSTVSPLTPTITFSPTFHPTNTPTAIPWQAFKMVYSIKIGGAEKLWMPVPHDWDGIGMANVSIIEITPQPDDVYQDSQGNKIAYWNIGYHNSQTYSIVFSVELAPINYNINSDQIGEYEKSSSEYERYTKPSIRIESDNPKIIQLAERITNYEINPNPYKAARLIHQWVSTKISGPGKDGETALSTLESMEGSCGGHSFLFVALLRSLGIPARIVGGLMGINEGIFSFQEHTLYTHVWSEFYLPEYGWIQSDTSQGDNRLFSHIDDKRVILFRGEDIELGHGYPVNSVPWFHIPHVNLLLNKGDPKTQCAGENLSLDVDTIP